MNPSNEFPGESHINNIVGYIDTFTEAPTYDPKSLYQQIVMVTAGASTSLYIYDTNATAWKRVSLS